MAKSKAGKRAARACVLGGALLATMAVVGCGAGSSGPTAADVGGVSIGGGTVAGWVSAIKLGSEVGSPQEPSGGTVRERALDLLIASHWLVGEAAERGLAVADKDIARGLQERIEAVPNGKPEFEHALSSTHRAIDDVKLEIEAELAASKLRELVLSRIPRVTQTEIADYYRSNQQQFRVPDLRFVDLIEAIESRAAAVALGRRLGPSKRFARKALNELVARQTPYEAAHRDNHELVHAIFAATPGRVAAPARLNHRWVVFVVRKVVPSHIAPLASVKEEILAQLNGQHHQRAVRDFLAAYRSKWVAKTDCRVGFVVQKCSQYHGPVKPEGDQFLSE